MEAPGSAAGVRSPSHNDAMDPANVNHDQRPLSYGTHVIFITEAWAWNFKVKTIP